MKVLNYNVLAATVFVYDGTLMKAFECFSTSDFSVDGSKLQQLASRWAVYIAI